MNAIRNFFLCMLLSGITGCMPAGKDNSGMLQQKGPGPLGQSLPGDEPELFAPGIASTGMASRDITISPDGQEVCFALSSHDFSYASIFISKKTPEGWTKPEILPFATDSRYLFFEPFLSPDGQRIFFLSNRPEDGHKAPANEDIWYSRRTPSGWSAPINAGPGVNTSGNEFFPSVTVEGTLYFTRADTTDGKQYIYRSAWDGEKFEEAERLPKQVNCGVTRFNAFVAPDESYVIVPAFGRSDSFGGADYYIVFRNQQEQWSQPQNMGPDVNSKARAEWSPYVSPDGRYFFFMSNRIPENKRTKKMTYSFFDSLQTHPLNGTSNTYWMKAEVIDSLRKTAVFE